MNANAKFLAEAKEIEERWAHIDEFYVAPDLEPRWNNFWLNRKHPPEKRWNRSACAVLLESQRLMNEVATDERNSF